MPAGESDLEVTLGQLTELVRKFTAERDWEQFHLPKNLLLALVGEVGELSEVFQWLTDDQAATVTTDSVLLDRAGEELADVLYYLLRLADVLGIDLGTALTTKLVLNAQKYPIDKARGSATKYTEL